MPLPIQSADSRFWLLRPIVLACFCRYYRLTQGSQSGRIKGYAMQEEQIILFEEMGFGWVVNKEAIQMIRSQLFTRDLLTEIWLGGQKKITQDASR